MSIECYNNLEKQFLSLIEQESLPESYLQQIKEFIIPLAHHLEQQMPSGQTYCIGINGGQGSGKSTLSKMLKLIFEEHYSKSTAVVSIDDIYFTHAERQELALKVHPLLATRGVPGTHDIQLGLDTINALKNAQANEMVAIPSFNKAIDDRKPKENWPTIEGPIDIVIFEGWCVGAVPEMHHDLMLPLNKLEKEEDPNMVWRDYVNQQLAEHYPPLFHCLDCLILLNVPSFEQVYEWRTLQEQKLIEANKDKTNLKTMNQQEIHRFIMHYERLTRHILNEMPQRADIKIDINKNHQFTSLTFK